MACRHTNVCVIRITRTSEFIYTTLDSRAKGVSHLRGKYEAVFMVVKYTLISIINLSFIKFARRFSNWLGVFS